jgi:predicted dehydrogenase/threonine dehydrogenase-like Zn-dependent dehydrogenase
LRVVLQDVKSGGLSIEEIPQPVVRRGSVLVRNVCSLVSAGTEKAVLEFSQANYLKKAMLRPDLFRKVLNRAKNDGLWETFKIVSELIEQKIPLGYSSAGVVVECGPEVTDVKVGDRVACAGLFLATHSEYVVVPRNLIVKIPDGCDFTSASFVTLGAIAVQGVRLAEITLGETVVVYGLGLLGMITAQLLMANGAKVIGTDLNPAKIEWLNSIGGIGLLAGESLPGAVTELTGGYGADKVLICAATKSNEPVETTAKLLKQKGIAVVVGDVAMNVPRRAYYDREIDIRISRSYGPGRYDLSYEFGGIDYPFPYVRWTQNRNMQCVLELAASRRIDLKSLVTHRYPIEKALSAYDLIEGKVPGPFVGIVIDYTDDAAAEAKTGSPVNIATLVAEKAETKSIAAARKRSNKISLGIIGAGNFGKAFLLPALANTGKFDFNAICTASGVSAASVAKKYSIGTVTSNADEIFGSPEIDAVMIATRHDSHASFVMKALAAGKSVFVEKPLAMTLEQLEGIEAAWSDVVSRTGHKPVLAVGFNRRFSPLTNELRQLVAKHKRPASLIYRINAGPLPSDSWHSDSEMGGGRIIGEACHFIDFATWVLGTPPIWVSANELASFDQATKDTVTINLGFANGSMASIHYCSNGNTALAKEQVEVFFGGVTARLENFMRLRVWGDKTKGKSSYWGQVKGFREEAQAFANRILRDPKAQTQDFDELLAVSRATIAVADAISSGKRVSI